MSDSLRPIERSARTPRALPWMVLWAAGVLVGFALVAAMLDGCADDHVELDAHADDHVELDACEASPAHACECPATVAPGARCSCEISCIVARSQCTTTDASAGYRVCVSP